MVPFSPVGRSNMVAWAGWRSDGEHYGEVMVFKFRKDSVTLGPAQIEARIDQDPDISQLLTLWDQGGSQVIRGNLLVLPWEQASCTSSHSTLSQRKPLCHSCSG